MARAKKKTRRGSPEAIAKRKAARALNRIFDEGGGSAALDGRTLKRKKRLMNELEKGRRGAPLKAHEVLSHASELLTLGESLTSLRKLKPMLPPTPKLDEETAEVVRQTQESYQFDPRAWKLLGIDVEKVTSGQLDAGKAGPGRSKKTAKKRAAKKKTTSRKKAG